MKFYKLIIFVFLLLSCQNNKSSNKQKNKESIQHQVIKVKTAIARKNTFNKQIQANGIVKAAQKTDLHFKNTGYLEKIAVKNGQYVKKGKFIAQLENELLHNNLKKAEIELAKARQKYEELLLSYNLNDSNVKPEVRQKLFVQSGLAEAENHLQEARIQYRNSILTAPFSGIVANVTTDTGKLVTPADTIATLINPHTYQVVFKLMENEIGFIKKGLKVQTKSISGNLPAQTAVINDINPMVDAGGTVTIKARLLNNNQTLVEGMHTYVTVNIPVSEMILIPKKALVVRNDKDVAFTLHKGNTAKWHYVEVFGENTTHYAISQGLKEGDTLIISNNMNLAHDSSVETEKE